MLMSELGRNPRPHSHRPGSFMSSSHDTVATGRVRHGIADPEIRALLSLCPAFSSNVDIPNPMLRQSVDGPSGARPICLDEVEVCLVESRMHPESQRAFRSRRQQDNGTPLHKSLSRHRSSHPLDHSHFLSPSNVRAWVSLTSGEAWSIHRRGNDSRPSSATLEGLRSLGRGPCQ
ncbi:hypothetical protein BKA70DRAFT_128152 [Coprinopsis sp. MPI-PUGE-AT-0042]|nr:hypothetical protein BKA70DRAFT_128152 [Coprinopsis sp. MPI-PUGE-AT-0042]